MEHYIKLFRSFRYAFEGIFNTIKAERNLRIHITCIIYMFSILGFTDWFTLSRTDWTVLLIASGTVIAGELINTAVENAVNLASEEISEYGKISKDAAAGAVLISAIFAVLCGIAILFQPEAFRRMFEYFSTNIPMLAVAVLSLIPATLFIFLGIPHKKEKK